MRAASWMAVIALSAAACGGGGSRPSSTSTTGEGPRATTSSTAAEVKAKTVTVAKTFWFAGFKVLVKSATLGPGPAQSGSPVAPVVSLVANFENVGVDTASFSGTVVLQSAGRNHLMEALAQALPRVPGGANQDGTLAITVDPTFTFDDALLVVGRVDNNQAKVPLGQSDGPFVPLEPQVVPVKARLSPVSLTIDVVGGELRADRPRAHDQVEAGRRDLKLSYTGTTGCQAVSFSFSLVLPDGRTIQPNGQGESLTLDSFVVFPVSDRPGGAYLLKLGGGFLNSTRPDCPKAISAEAPFTLA